MPGNEQSDTQYVDSYYSRTLDDVRSYLPLQETLEVDVCVIGGGFAGLATALGLVERGKSVAVLESRRIGWGASGRNGGFVIAGYGMSASALTKKVGYGHARDLYGLTQDARQLIRDRINKYDIPANPVDGHIVCSWYDMPAKIKEKAEYLQSRFDEKTAFWDRRKVHDHFATDKYFDALVTPDNFHMHPLQYARGQARAITDKGGHIFENSEAINIQNTATGGKIVHTAKGMVKADHIVLCGSAYFNGLNKKLSNACLKVSTYVMVTEPLDAKLLAKTIGSKMCIRDNRYADDYYRILPDNSILWGGRVGIKKAPSPEQLKILMLGDLLSIYPQLEGKVKPRVAWSGLMGYNIFKLPHIGRFDDGIWYCTNFGGHGVCPTTAGGEVIAKAIAENDESYKLFEPFGFAYTGGALGPLVAQLVYHSWEIADKIKTLRYGS